MSTQANLFEAPLPPNARKSDPVSSKISGAAIRRSGKELSQCEAVLRLVKRFPGLTSKELAAKTWEFDRYVVARRLSTLEHLGKVRKSGEKGKRKECTWEAC